MRVLQLISLCGLLAGLTVVVDRVLPKISSESRITYVSRGMERGKSMSTMGSRASFLTHFNVFTANHDQFPVFIEDYDYFKEGQFVAIYYSRLLKKPVYMVNQDNQQKAMAALGLYSYFLLSRFCC